MIGVKLSHYYSKILIATSLLGLLACTAVNFTGVSGKSLPSKSPTPNASPTKNDGAVLPPVPVAGAYLTGVLNDENGDVIASAALEIIENKHSTRTDTLGQFKIPVSKIPAGVFLIEVDLPNRESNLTLETTLPSDIRTLIDNANAATTANVALARALGLALPWGVNRDDENSEGEQRLLFATNSLPLPKGTQRVSNYTGLINESAGNTARFKWSHQVEAAASVKLMHSLSESLIQSWDGANESALVSNGATLLTNFSSCNDVAYTLGAGSFTTASTAQCGVSLANPPYSNSLPNFFRLAIVTPSELKLSAIFEIKDKVPSWLSYHENIESCYPNYRGPAVPTLNFGNTLPSCTMSTNLNAVWCKSSSDGSPSKCLGCENNLFICR
jgi:hypothetical protein